MYICICNAITETELRASVAAGASNFEELQLDTGVGSCCGTCVGAAEALLGECPDRAACQASLPLPVAAARVPVMRTASTPAPAPAPAPAVPVRWVSRVPAAHAQLRAA